MSCLLADPERWPRSKLHNTIHSQRRYLLVRVGAVPGVCYTVCCVRGEAWLTVFTRTRRRFGVNRDLLTLGKNVYIPGGQASDRSKVWRESSKESEAFSFCSQHRTTFFGAETRYQ